MKKPFILLMLLLLLSCPIYAVTIGVSPSIINSRNMIRGGYAENMILISTNTPSELWGHFEIEEEFISWISFEPESEQFTISSANPYGVKIIITPPEDTPNGNYSTLITILSDAIVSPERGAGSSVIAAIGLRLNIEVTDVETVMCNAGALYISATEIGEPFTVGATVLNTGNIRLRPTFLLEVYDQDQENLLMRKTFAAKDRILPTTSGRVFQEVEHNLEIGQYFAQLTVTECEASAVLTFDVVERGGIVDTGELMVIRTNEYAYVDQPTPIVPLFRNTGPRNVVAKFKGQIESLDDKSIVSILESDELQVLPGETMEFPMFFIPEKAGKYQVSGRVFYNKKITFEEKSKVFEVVRGKKEAPKLGVIILIIIYLIIGLLIFILIGLIRKERKKFRKRF
ncbi:hypothetical protein JW930_06910 [Candidatus Woesearchaeota archaeon]|nr:hypothetical protein [Candidatus Woesearchaeota archaeon]